MDWGEVLKIENGGPGDSPGREEAVKRAKAKSAKKKEEKAAGRPKR